MIAQQAAFWWPPRAAAWNYVEFLVVFGSVAIAVLKAYSDRTDLGFPAFGSLLPSPAPCSLCCPRLSSLVPACRADLEPPHEWQSLTQGYSTAPFPEGAEQPVVSCNVNPDLCAGYCGTDSAGSNLGTVRKGLTASRIIARIAIGLRFMRAVFKAAKVARSFLGRKVVTYDGHEAAVSDFSLCFIDGKHRMVTASEDSYLRLWDIDPNL